MPDPQNPHSVPHDTIPDNIGLARHQFSHRTVWHGPSNIRKVLQAVARCNQRIPNLGGGLGIEIDRIVINARDLTQRGR